MGCLLAGCCVFVLMYLTHHPLKPPPPQCRDSLWGGGGGEVAPPTSNYRWLSANRSPQYPALKPRVILVEKKFGYFQKVCLGA